MCDQLSQLVFNRDRRGEALKKLKMTFLLSPKDVERNFHFLVIDRQIDFTRHVHGSVMSNCCGFPRAFENNSITENLHQNAFLKLASNLQGG